jgi:DNA-binding Lrp family transcriptional regulator
MLKNNDIRLITHLRNNSRKKITRIAREERIPATTIYDKLRAHEKNFVKKHTTLLDFQKLGLNAKAHIAIRVDRPSREDLRKYLLEHPNINSLYQVNTGHDFLAECVFKDAMQQREFIEAVEAQNAELTIYNEIQELRKEDFLSKEEHSKVLM